MGDRMRELWGTLPHFVNSHLDCSGIVYYPGPGLPYKMLASTDGTAPGHKNFGISAARIAPVGAVTAPRSWGSLACAYFGHPTS